MDKQRKRSANFTEHEKEVLVTLVQKYFDIIENKKTNAVFNKKKLECWEKLACEYNSTSTSGLRTGVQLKSAYEQFKKTAKQHKAQDKVKSITSSSFLINKSKYILGRIIKDWRRYLHTNHYGF